MPASASMPVAGAQSGSMFSDRDDAGLTWYLPTFAPLDPSDAFAFAASEGSTVGSSGDLLDTATLTVPVMLADPPDVVSARQANPGGRYEAITALAYEATLTLPYKDEQGADQVARVPGHLAVQTGGLLLATFAGLLGSTVIQAYEELADVGGASIEIGLTYNLWRRFIAPRRRFLPEPLIHVGLSRAEGGAPAEVGAPDTATDAAPGARSRPDVRPPVAQTLPSMRVGQARPILPNPVPIDPAPIGTTPIRVGPALPIVPIPLPPEGVWIVATERAVCGVQLQTVYAAARYRPKYTIAPRSGPTRPIIDASDLKEFNAARSEFRELTSLGDVRTRYPSFEGLYLGQVSGTVVVIPAAYGIVHGRGGCAARIDAVIDTSSTSASGCRFQLTFQVAPILDPVDVAQLIDDLRTVPEAARLVLTPTAPAVIDRRVAPTFSATVTNLVYADASDGSGLLMSFEVTDTGTTPALVNVNLLLAQLTSASTTPLFGTIGVRLDDVYTPPVQATVVINLHTTCSTDDVAVAGESPAVTMTNQSPNDVRLLRMRTLTTQQATVHALGNVLPAGQRADLSVADPGTVTSAVVQRALELPDPLPRSALGQYLDIHAEIVQQAMHALTVNATAVDFSAEGITELDVQITLDALPATAVPRLTLAPEHRVDGANVVVPIEAALTGLSATLTISVHTVGSTNDRQVELSNDFAANPIFVLTPAALATVAQSSVPAP